MNEQIPLIDAEVLKESARKPLPPCEVYGVVAYSVASKRWKLYSGYRDFRNAESALYGMSPHTFYGARIVRVRIESESAI